MLVGASVAATSLLIVAPPGRGGAAGPAGPYVIADFQNGTYETEAGASSFAALFEANPDFSADPLGSPVPGTGIVQASENGGSLGSQLTVKDLIEDPFLAGCVIVLEGVVTTQNAGTVSLGFVSASLGDAPDYTTYWGFDYTISDGSGAPSGHGNVVDADSIFDNVNSTYPAGGVFKLAARLAADGLSLSINGEAVYTSGVPAFAAASSLIGFSIFADGEGGASAQTVLRRLEIYTADEYAADDLASLSAP